MDALKANDHELDRSLDPARKLALALETMSAGIRLKRSNLRRQFPDADHTEVERLLAVWLAQDD